MAARLRSPWIVESQEEIGFCLDGIAKDGSWKKRNLRTAVEELFSEVVLLRRKPGNEAGILF